MRQSRLSLNLWDYFKKLKFEKKKFKKWTFKKIKIFKKIKTWSCQVLQFYSLLKIKAWNILSSQVNTTTTFGAAVWWLWLSQLLPSFYNS